MSQNLQNFVKFQKSQLDNLVDFEKCCKTRIFLQKSFNRCRYSRKRATFLPKFCRSAVVLPTRRSGSLTDRAHAVGLAAQLRDERLVRERPDLGIN